MTLSLWQSILVLSLAAIGALCLLLFAAAWYATDVYFAKSAGKR